MPVALCNVADYSVHYYYYFSSVGISFQCEVVYMRTVRKEIHMCINRHRSCNVTSRIQPHCLALIKKQYTRDKVIRM
jgi:hypothetical protein